MVTSDDFWEAAVRREADRARGAVKIEALMGRNSASAGGGGSSGSRAVDITLGDEENVTRTAPSSSQIPVSFEGGGAGGGGGVVEGAGSSSGEGAECKVENQARSEVEKRIAQQQLMIDRLLSLLRSKGATAEELELNLESESDPGSELQCVRTGAAIISLCSTSSDKSEDRCEGVAGDDEDEDEGEVEKDEEIELREKNEEEGDRGEGEGEEAPPDDPHNITGEGAQEAVVEGTGDGTAQGVGDREGVRRKDIKVSVTSDMTPKDPSIDILDSSDLVIVTEHDLMVPENKGLEGEDAA